MVISEKLLIKVFSDNPCAIACYDLVQNTTVTFLLEEVAGSEDTDFMASLLYQYILQEVDTAQVRELVVVLDNCS